MFNGGRMIVGLTPGKIRVLPEDVVGRIAAGEIVERPAAVVKELIENSLDAGSTTITVEVSEGGRTSIKVIDDGEGMSAADVPLAFERHATSKLQTEADLWGIRTMGFRGEALASIAAVAKVGLLTARHGEQTGTRFEAAGGMRTRLEEAASPVGTQIEIADLFFNTPARKKFLKTTGTEFSHICQVVQQTALSWPTIHFRLSHNGQSVLNYPSAASVPDRMRQVYGPRLLNQMVMVDEEGSGIRVHGVVVQAMHARAGRSPQELFVNRRSVRNATVSHAVYDGYGGAIAKGCHPLFVLFLETDPGRVDVNVHPTKREVRFVDQESVHQTVRRAVRSALSSSASGLPAITVGMPAVQFMPPVEQAGNRERRGPVHPSEEGTTATSQYSANDQPNDFVQETLSPYLVRPSADITPLGQMARTFLIAQVGEELHVIDQHTAHERVLFERLWRMGSSRTPASQCLLIPQPLELPPHAVAVLKELIPDLASLGFEIEPFGSGTFVVRAVPALIAVGNVHSLLQDVLDDLGECRFSMAVDERLRPVVASLACHAAIRAGRPMALPEIKTLVEDWVGEGLPTTCPHGRRIALRLPVEELEKIFGR